MEVTYEKAGCVVEGILRPAMVLLEADAHGDEYGACAPAARDYLCGSAIPALRMLLESPAERPTDAIATLYDHAATLASAAAAVLRLDSTRHDRRVAALTLDLVTQIGRKELAV